MKREISAYAVHILMLFYQLEGKINDLSNTINKFDGKKC